MTVTGPDLAASLLWALNAKRLIAKRVSDQMTELGIGSDEELAQMAGVKTKTIWRLRNGKSYPRKDTAERVAAALGLPASDLRPPQTPDEDPELREQLQEVLGRLQRIEVAVGVPTEPAADEADLEEIAEGADDLPPHEQSEAGDDEPENPAADG